MPTTTRSIPQMSDFAKRKISESHRMGAIVRPRTAFLPSPMLLHWEA